MIYSLMLRILDHISLHPRYLPESNMAYTIPIVKDLIKREGSYQAALASSRYGRGQ